MQNELESAGQDKPKGQGKIDSARKRVLNKYLSDGSTKGQYADPAAFFQSRGK